MVRPANCTTNDPSGPTVKTPPPTFPRSGSQSILPHVPILQGDPIAIAVPMADPRQSPADLQGRRVQHHNTVPVTSTGTLGMKKVIGRAKSRTLRRVIDVGCFPPELLSEILVWFCASPAQLPVREISSDAFTFGQVCRMWRDVASLKKDVWSSLRLNWAQCTSIPVAQESATSVAHIMSLSGDRPLNLQLTILAPRSDINGEALRAILAPIFSQSSRWQNFSLTCSSEALEIITLVENPFSTQLPTPLLEKFIVRSNSRLPHTSEAQWPNTPLMDRLSAPLLRRAAFLDDAMMFTHPETLPWDQLCELDLLGLSVRVGFDEYAKILGRAERMRKLRIAVDRGLESNEPIVLDNLEILHILEHGDAPVVPQYHSIMCGGLVELSVEYAGDRASDDDAEHTLADMLGPIDQLRRLHLQNVPLSEEGLIRTLSQCPQLTHLSVSNNESSDYNLPLTSQALLQLTISRKRTPLPELEHVLFASKACSRFHIEKFVGSRWDAPNNTTKLRKFVYSSLGVIPEVTLRSRLAIYTNHGLVVEIFENDPHSPEAKGEEGHSWDGMGITGGLG